MKQELSTRKPFQERYFFDRRVLQNKNEQDILTVQGMVQSYQPMGSFAFLRLRLADLTLQCVLTEDVENKIAEAVTEECSVLASGRLCSEPRAPHGRELRLTALKVCSRPTRGCDIPLHKKQSGMKLSADLARRPVSLRQPQHRAVFKLQEGICRGFRDFLQMQGFTEIHTPKIVASGAEGGSNIFFLDYFGRQACLAQSPQLYKQMMVGVYQRVFEVGPVFRAEKHHTARHLNEYTSLDFEMGFIESFHDIMDMETAMLRSLFRFLEEEYAPYLRQLKVPELAVEAIPAITFDDAKRQVAAAYDRPIRDPYDLEPEEERLLGALFLKKGEPFVFVTHYPSRKRPFYTMDDPQQEGKSLSFDLLYQGLEITTGGQRIHDHDQQVAKMQRLHMEPEEFSDYLSIHAAGMPPHGGLGIGLERLLMQLIGADNIRKAALFPRDVSRIEP